MQPASFAFTPENKAWAEKEIAKYPPGRQASAVHRAAVARAGAERLLAAEARDREGRGRCSTCRTSACSRSRPSTRCSTSRRSGATTCSSAARRPACCRGADDIKAVCRKRIGEQGHVTADGMFSWIEVECLGACCNAPMVQINDDYYEDLTPRELREAARRSRRRPAGDGRLADRARLVRAGRRPDLADDALWRRRQERPAASRLRFAAIVSARRGSGFPPRLPTPSVAGSGRPPAAASRCGCARSTRRGVDRRRTGAPTAVAAPLQSAARRARHRPQLGEAEAHAHAAAEEEHIGATLAKLPADATPEQKANAVGARPLALPAPRER